ncbi:MAG TPA: TldD/PmbA family protein [Syntrophomonas sp.]|nr:TldD/PmbA family protein [Syntrophomonas sp.]
MRTSEEILTAAGAAAIDAARKKGAEAEAFLLHNRELSIEVRDAEVQTIKDAEEIGLGVRVLHGGRMGFAFSSDLSAAAVAATVDSAVAIAKHMQVDAFYCLAEPAASYPSIDCFDPRIETAALEEKIELARNAEKSARAYDNRIYLVDKAGYENSSTLTVIMNSRGLQVSCRDNLAGVYISLAAQEEGDSQTGFATMTRRKIADMDSRQLGQEAAFRAVRGLQAKSMDSGKMPCIMEPYVAIRFMGLLLPSLCGDAVLKGKSMWAGKMGEQVASPLLELVDDGIREGGLASVPFDGEGVPARRNELIRQGVLQGYLYDIYSGRKAGCASTGSGRRGTFRSLPAIGSSNLMISPGRYEPEQMLAGIDRGLLITDVMGLHTANTISGDFSLGASGVLIEGGRLTRPVRGITIAGTLHGLLQEIEALGSDLTFYGAKVAPSIRFRQLSIAGE